MSADSLAEQIEERAAKSAKRDKSPDSPATGADDAKSKPKKTRTRSRSKGGRKKLREPLTELLTLVGVGLSYVDEFDGQVVTLRAEKVARELDRLAQDNARVHRVLSSLCDVSAFGAVAGVLASVAVPIAMHHEAIPPNPILVGMFVPDELQPKLYAGDQDDDDQDDDGGGQ